MHILSVNSSTVILKGLVETYEERRLVGQAAWNVSGVSKVLNDLQVTKPETAGPRKVSAHRHKTLPLQE